MLVDGVNVTDGAVCTVIVIAFDTAGVHGLFVTRTLYVDVVVGDTVNTLPDTVLYVTPLSELNSYTVDPLVLP